MLDGPVGLPSTTVDIGRIYLAVSAQNEAEVSICGAEMF